MKRGGAGFFGIAASATLLYAAIWAQDVFAYRPFDATDASTADAGEFELELGPVGYLREGSERSLIAPAVVANFGLSEDREIVLEGKLKTLLDNPPGDHWSSVEDAALSLKQLLRRGSLQDGAGPSIASECGVLLPTVHGEYGAGASCAGIVSQRWPVATVHINASVALDRRQQWNQLLSGIVEGPYVWPVRPVLEVYGERDTSGARMSSILIGMIYRARKDISFDLAVRTAQSNDLNVLELRVGLTWAQSQAASK